MTNLGAAAVDTGAFFYDDESADIGDAGQLDSFVLNQGESAVFLIDDEAGAIAEFQSVWGNGISVGLTNGGGGLSQNGDTVNLMDNIGQVLDAVVYDGALGGALQTIENLGGAPGLSVLGVNGAFESSAFFNDDFGVGPDFLITLVGSPGAIPAPSAAALLGLTGLASARRRRR